MMTISGRHWLGWVPDYPDFRDYTVATQEVKPLLQGTGLLGDGDRPLPAAVDLRSWCSEVEDQQNLGSCTAQAGAGLIEYFERKAFGRHVDCSRLFLYKVARNLLQQKGDTGATLRGTMGALALFGVPPEEYWPYEIGRFDDEPPAFCYAFAQNYQALKYVRLDPAGQPPEETLRQARASLAAGIPPMFGFTAYSSIAKAETDGLIPFPGRGERIVGGHAVLAVGYDDHLAIASGQGKGTLGALLVRNSWGAGWGQQGYGWLPYDYVTKGLARDWWTLLDSKWIDTGLFRI